jgi:hypothetical protein
MTEQLASLFEEEPRPPAPHLVGGHRRRPPADLRRSSFAEVQRALR